MDIEREKMRKREKDTRVILPRLQSASHGPNVAQGDHPPSIPHNVRVSHGMLSSPGPIHAIPGPEGGGLSQKRART